MSRVEYIDNDSDNLASIVLYANGGGLDLEGSGVTRVVVYVDDADDTEIDSNLVDMSWSESDTDDDGITTYPIQFKGADAGLSAGIYRDCRVKIFDATNPNGIVWPKFVTLVVH